jgi:steroid 5-alpha reductase family enzyme
MAISAGVVVVVLGVTFGITVWRGRHDTIDTTWGLGLAAVALASAGYAPEHWRGWMVAVLTTAWGFRLATHIHYRNAQGGEDPRYAEMARKAGGHPNRHLLLVVYPTQGIAMWVVSLPTQAAAHLTGGFGALDVIGGLVWLGGLAFEAVGDAQLAAFKADPANRPAVMDRGLWRYSRHPNYFGDACVWWGLYLVACHHWIGVVTIVSPLLMTALLTRGTGKAMTERHMTSSRPGYRDYVERTSGFVPLPPRARPRG